MKVFVTGVTGYIGGSVAVRLIEAGHSVRGLARNEGQFDALSRWLEGVEHAALATLDVDQTVTIDD